MNIAVLFGGSSTERDVSAASAAHVIAGLRSSGHAVVAVDDSRGVLAEREEHALLTGRIDALPPDRATGSGLLSVLARGELGSVDLVFLALHGGVGENGTVQAVLDLAGVPYTGSGRLGSVLGMDKAVSKQLFRGAGVPTAQWLTAPATAHEVADTLGFPVIVKPNAEGSTVGLTFVENPDGLQPAIDVAGAFDDTVLIERFVAGREVTVGILDDEPLAVGEIIPAQGQIFDYQSKYQSGGAAEIFPAALDPEQTERVQVLGLAAHRALRLESYSRADFRLDADGKLWCLEVNTLPGLTAGSLLPRSAAANGMPFPELCERICAAALAR